MPAKRRGSRKPLKPAFDEHILTSEFRLAVAHAIEARGFEVEHFATVMAFDDQATLLRHTLASVDARLDTWVELGVATGRSTRAIARMAAALGRRPELHAFDSFEGLPEDFIPGVEKGAFATAPPSFDQANIKLHVGWFRDTLPEFAASLDGQIGFVHCDADLYSSTRTAFDALTAHLGPGTVLLFDEYWNFPGCYEHEFRAFQEFLERARLHFRYLGYNKDYTQASVTLLAGD
jgi:predicted O-methyltransferase YrrM